MSLNKENPSKEQFEKFYEKPNPWNHDGTVNDLVRHRILKNIFSKSQFASGIDVACGEGFLTARMVFVERMIGIDISEKAISRATSAYPDIKFVSGDAFKDRVVDGTFDFVSCFEALYYPSSFEERKKALDNLRNYGSDTATFAFSVVTIGENKHRKYFTKREFMYLLSEVGFTTVGVYGFVLGGKKGSSLIIRLLRKVFVTILPFSIVEKLISKFTMNASDDFIYQHLFICKKKI